MAETKKTILFIVADEKKNAGDRDAMKAIAAAIGDRRDPALQYLVYKVPTAAAKDLTVNALGITTDPRRLPKTDAEYKSINPISDLALDDIDGEVQILGVGSETLDTAIWAANYLKGNGIEPEVHYMTHNLELGMMKDVVENKFTAITPTTRDNLKKLNETLGGQIKLLQIDAMPHTNMDVMDDYLGFMATDNGKAVHNMIMNSDPFVFAVINAGVKIGDERIPYTEKEAADHGYALGASFPPGTNLIVSHGGPRNLIDERDHGQMTADAFAEGFRAAQKTKQAVITPIIERYAEGTSYNMIKAGYMLSQQDGFAGFISNSEGYGTMDGAVLHVNNREVLLGMFPFEALKMDPTGQRQENMEKYAKLGVATLTVRPEDGRLAIGHHKSEVKTPIKQEDAAAKIVKELKLAIAPATPGAIPGFNPPGNAAKPS